VVRETAIRKTIRFPFNAGRHNSGCGNVIATASANAPTTVFRAIAEAPLQVRQRDPRRAHARRSCACAFVHSKSRRSVGERTAREQERGASVPLAIGQALARECDFCDARTHVPKGGWRKPPVVTRPRLQRRFSARWWQSREQLRECRWMNDSVNHGGLTPGAPAPRVRRRCLNLGVIIFARAFPTITAG